MWRDDRPVARPPQRDDGGVVCSRGQVAGVITIGAADDVGCFCGRERGEGAEDDESAHDGWLGFYYMRRISRHNVAARRHAIEHNCGDRRRWSRLGYAACRHHVTTRAL